MTMLYPIVFESEDSGAVSASVPGLSVDAAAEIHGDRRVRFRSAVAAATDRKFLILLNE
jgi:hypothetical protein